MKEKGESSSMVERGSPTIEEAIGGVEILSRLIASCCGICVEDGCVVDA